MREHLSDQEPGVLYPLRSVDALPVGLQVIGPLFGDLAVLRACHAYEEAAGVSWPSAELTTRLGEICHLGRGHARQQAVDEASRRHRRKFQQLNTWALAAYLPASDLKGERCGE
jgi:hypothetical protein